MEKVVVATHWDGFSTNDCREVNEELKNGWTVKSIATGVYDKHGIFVVFVLQKEE